MGVRGYKLRERVRVSVSGSRSTLAGVACLASLVRSSFIPRFAQAWLITVRAGRPYWSLFNIMFTPFSSHSATTVSAAAAKRCAPHRDLALCALADAIYRGETLGAGDPEIFSNYTDLVPVFTGDLEQHGVAYVNAREWDGTDDASAAVRRGDAAAFLRVLAAFRSNGIYPGISTACSDTHYPFGDRVDADGQRVLAQTADGDWCPDVVTILPLLPTLEQLYAVAPPSCRTGIIVLALRAGYCAPGPVYTTRAWRVDTSSLARAIAGCDALRVDASAHSSARVSVHSAAMPQADLSGVFDIVDVLLTIPLLTVEMGGTRCAILRLVVWLAQTSRMRPWFERVCDMIDRYPGACGSTFYSECANEAVLETLVCIGATEAIALLDDPPAGVAPSHEQLAAELRRRHDGLLAWGPDMVPPDRGDIVDIEAVLARVSGGSSRMRRV